MVIFWDTCVKAEELRIFITQERRDQVHHSERRTSCLLRRLSLMALII